MGDAPTIPTVVKADTPQDFDLIVEKARKTIARLCPLDYDKLRAEMADLNVPTTENPTVQKLNQDIQRVQAAKDRMATILVDVDRECQVKTRCAELLTEGWAKFSSEGSQDKRKADALLRMSDFSEAALEAESLYRTANTIMKNLDAKQGSLSRQVTVFQQLLKLRDINRGLPDGDFVPGMGEDSDMKDWDKQPS